MLFRIKRLLGKMFKKERISLAEVQKGGDLD